MNHGDWAGVAGGAAGATGGFTLALFSIAAEWLQGLAPPSAAMAVVAFVVKWIFNLGYAVMVGAGGFMGGTLAWFVWDISHHLR